MNLNQDILTIDDFLDEVEEKRIENKEKNKEKIWITKDRQILEIKNLSQEHIENIDNYFQIMFKRLLNIKIEIFKRKIIKFIKRK